MYHEYLDSSRGGVFNDNSDNNVIDDNNTMYGRCYVHCGREAGSEASGRGERLCNHYHRGPSTAVFDHNNFHGYNNHGNLYCRAMYSCCDLYWGSRKAKSEASRR